MTTLATPLRRFCWLVLIGLGSILSASAQTPVLRLILPDRTLTFTAEELAALPRSELTLPDMQDKETRRFSGVSMRDLLVKAGLPLGEKMRGPALGLGVVVRSKDNYTVLFALAEFDENFSQRTILLADQEDGERLPPSSAPLRLVVPGDKRGARAARQIVSIEVVSFGQR